MYAGRHVSSAVQKGDRAEDDDRLSARELSAFAPTNRLELSDGSSILHAER